MSFHKKRTKTVFGSVCLYIFILSASLLTPKQARASSDLDLEITDQAANELSCQRLLDESVAQTMAQSDLVTILELEKRISQLREDNGQIERRNVAENRKREAQLSIHIQRGEQNAAIDLYRTIFRSVEYSYLRVKQIRMELATLAPLSVEDMELGSKIHDQIFFLVQEQRDLLKQFGENYAEYIRARQKLERMIQEAEARVTQVADLEHQAAETSTSATKADLERYAKNARSVLESLQLKSLLPAVPESGLRRRAITTRELHGFFKSEPDAIIAHLESDLREEERVRRWAAIYPVLEVFRSAVYRLPTWAVRPTSLALGLSYNHYVREKYFPDIERLLRYHSNGRYTLPQLYDELTKINAKYATVRQDEMLVTFERVKEATELWHLLKAEAKARAALPDQIIYTNFHERILKAEERAVKFGDLPLYFEGSVVDKKVVSAIGFVTGSAGAYLIWGQDIQNWVTNFLAWIGA